jgi:predicted MPP superfamily phosphohydrolase
MPAVRIRHIVQHMNALKPDVIVLLGDFVASHRFKTRAVAPQVWSEQLGALKAQLGVHAILGNHDWWDDREAQDTGKGPVLARRVLERVGIPVYENDVTRLSAAIAWLAVLEINWRS